MGISREVAAGTSSARGLHDTLALREKARVPCDAEPISRAGPICPSAGRSMAALPISKEQQLVAQAPKPPWRRRRRCDATSPNLYATIRNALNSPLSSTTSTSAPLPNPQVGSTWAISRSKRTPSCSRRANKSIDCCRPGSARYLTHPAGVQYKAVWRNRPCNEALHQFPRRIIRRILAAPAFSYTQGQHLPCRIPLPSASVRKRTRDCESAKRISSSRRQVPATSQVRVVLRSMASCR